MTAISAKKNWQDLSVSLLNEIFEPLSAEDRIRALYKYFPEEDVLYTSSFGTKSVLLLHLIHRIRPSQQIHFIDTTYHFPETIGYKKKLTDKYGLQVVDVLPREEENAITREGAWWREHPRMCCSINKVVPLEPIKARHRVWMSGLMAHQTDYRARLRVFEKQGDIVKFHPLIDLDEGEFLYYLGYHQLPRHPLEEQGYGSVGCLHCTHRGEGRNGRWHGTKQEECGLHPNYFVNKLKAKQSSDR
ncbi:MAG: phosphoadenylyl-sulfate reductase [Saprospiraceae bacterium]|nr:phosphoadenylyl-sulfate reductase [Saprospiraceae bacterium]